MNGNAHIDTNRDMLKRIIVLLLALAGAAENAARRSYPVRVFVLKVLRWAEPVGRRVVAREACYLRAAPWLISSAEAHTGTSRAAAISLGLCFRLLALALAKLSALARRFGHLPGKAGAPGIRHLAENLILAMAAFLPASPRLDSS